MVWRYAHLVVQILTLLQDLPGMKVFFSVFIAHSNLSASALTAYGLLGS